MTSVPLLLFSLSFAQCSHHICFATAAPPRCTSCPLSLNSLDLAGVRLLSPRDSQILPKPVAGAVDTSANDAAELKEELDEDRVRCVVSFPFDQ